MTSNGQTVDTCWTMFPAFENLYSTFFVHLYGKNRDKRTKNTIHIDSSPSALSASAVNDDTTLFGALK